MRLFYIIINLLVILISSFVLSTFFFKETTNLKKYTLWNGQIIWVDEKGLMNQLPNEHVLTINMRTGETIFKTLKQSAEDVWIKGKEHTVIFKYTK